MHRFLLVNLQFIGRGERTAIKDWEKTDFKRVDETLRVIKLPHRMPELLELPLINQTLR